MTGPHRADAILRRRITGVSYGIIEVSDTGIGMDEETRKQCLEPFFPPKVSRGQASGWRWSTE